MRKQRRIWLGGREGRQGEKAVLAYRLVVKKRRDGFSPAGVPSFTPGNTKERSPQEQRTNQEGDWKSPGGEHELAHSSDGEPNGQEKTEDVHLSLAAQALAGSLDQGKGGIHSLRTPPLKALDSAVVIGQV